MPRQAGFAVENSFVRGLITEATGLNFPENACTETYDCVFSERGYVTRRLGFDPEGDAANKSINKTDSVTVEYLWTAAGSSGDAELVVVQVGATLYYYIASEDDSLSNGILVDTTNLTTFEVTASSNVKGNICQFASGQGYLFVVHPLLEPFYVSYNPNTGAITETAITIKCRDFEGDRADANYENIFTRPGTNSNAHHYNLKNQGWADDVVENSGTTTNPVTEWDSNRTDFPSNADVWWFYKDTSERFDISMVDRRAIGNTPAPKGHYILNEFSTNRSSLSGLASITERTSGGKRPTTVAFFSSRIWYAGVAAQDYNQKIYFSQIIDNPSQFGKCYQLNDPTSEDLSDLLDTDGGVITIPDVGQVVKLFAMASSIIVFGTNGVWAISGSEGVGFKATDYSVRKVSAVETLSPLSFVDIYGIPVWWNAEGIFTLNSDNLSLSENLSSLSDDAIRSFLSEIPSANKAYVKGAFNPRTRIIQWLYRSTEAATVEERYTYDRILNFNLLTKAFYPWTISQPTSGPRIHGIITSRGPLSENTVVQVVDGSAVNVIDSNGDLVIINSVEGLNSTYSFRYYQTTNTGASSWNATWAQTISDIYLDWTTADHDVDYESYFFTGYRVHGDASRFFESNYITVFMTTENNSSCFLQGVWDYANSPTSARFTNAQQIYRDKLQRDVQQTRKKIRGRGRTLQFKFYSEEGKPFTIHGWSTWETQNAGV